jgi:hypothetical protein
MRRDEVDRYLKASYPGKKAKPKFKTGDKVKFRRVALRNGAITRGSGVVTSAFPAYGNLPVHYFVDTFKRGVLFEGELRAK